MRTDLYPAFNLILMVTHACNLDCSYCYGGRKFEKTMRMTTGRVAINRAMASLRRGGTLHLGFFGGEPLLAAPLVTRLMKYAGDAAGEHAIALRTSLTTNGTIATAEAMELMRLPELDLVISCDGPKHIHDRNRPSRDGTGSLTAVLDTMRRLRAAQKKFRVVTVVRPDTVAELAGSVAFLRQLGVAHVDLALDLWTEWTDSDAERLREAIRECSRLWFDGLPECGINWFDEKAALLSGLPQTDLTECGFGDGQIAVSPSGSIYPCEELIGEDRPGSPMRLPGRVSDGGNFCGLAVFRGRDNEACNNCAAAEVCNTTCRCNNYVRTGDVRRPDGLLCLLNQATLEAVAGLIKTSAPPQPGSVAAGFRRSLVSESATRHENAA